MRIDFKIENVAAEGISSDFLIADSHCFNIARVFVHRGIMLNDFKPFGRIIAQGDIKSVILCVRED